MLNFLKKISNNKVIRNIAIVGGVALLVKVVAFYKEVLIASTFGLSMLLDTFLIAVLIPGFIRTVFIGSLNNIFIPNYISEKKGKGNLGSFQSVIFLLITGIMIFFVALVYLSTDLFVEVVFPNKEVEYYTLVKKQIHYVIPSLFFMGYNTVLSGLLEIEGKFFIANIGAFLFPLTTIALLIFAREELGDMVLALGFLIGTILSFIYLLIQAKLNRVVFFKKPVLNINSRTMLQQVPHKVMAGFFAGGSSFVDQYFAGQLAIGSIAAINYGKKIPSFSLSFIIKAIGKVLLPHFSKLVASNITKGYDSLFKTLKAAFSISCIISLTIYMLSPEIISLIFERNKFTAEDAYLVSNIQRIMIIYVPFALCSVILTKFLTTLNENKFMARMSFVNFILNIILNYILIEEYGLYGIALATTIVYITRCIIYFSYILRLRKKSLLNEH